VRHRPSPFVLIVVVTGLALSSAAYATHDFSDVPTSSPFHDDISWLAESGITTGFPDDTYRPNEPVSRQAMAAFMRRLAGQDPDVEPVVDAATLGGQTADDLRDLGAVFGFGDINIIGTTPATATEIGDLAILEPGSYLLQFSGMVNTSSDSALLSCVGGTNATAAFPGLSDIKVGDATVGYADRLPFSAQRGVLVVTTPTEVSVSCFLQAVVGGGSTLVLNPSLSVIRYG
jgi:hypothetical protein